ncbi:IclR family transcriptional regulator [Algihabitans albus]|uniref:IclR family transcriptional regulator n=1 Tax=Algihabitans albus TaxID=2164067 RepID=UPI001F28098A|nr:IclR family transcriptional regulator [Algihabitans albus]
MKKRRNYSGPNMAGFDTEERFEGDRQFVSALYRGLRLLRCFRPSDSGGLGNLELAQRSALPNSTVSRLTYTLSKLGYLIYDESNGRYRMGVPVLSLGYACLGGMKIRETAQVYMQEMASKSGGGVLVALGARDGLSMTYVACARSEGLVSLQLAVGSRISLARSAIGRAYLAGAGEEERGYLMERIRERVGPERWPQMEEEILDALEQVRSKGFYTNLGQWQPDVHAVAVPYRAPQGDTPLLAFNCGGPAYLLPKERLEDDLGPRLVELVNTVSRADTGF